MVGIVTQKDLSPAGPLQLSPDTPLQQIMTPWPITVRSGDALPDVLYLLNRFHLSRLPVVEGQKLVGIITRSDIIRAEARKLSGEREQLAERQHASYRVYQTRSPALGQGRILLPMANPKAAEAMLQLAAAIANQQQAELECLQVIPVPRHCDPMRTPVSTTLSRKLLRRAQALGEKTHLPVHTQIRVSTDIAQAILETIQERHINLLVMGWEGQPSTAEWIFGSVVDQIIRDAPCDVMLVKLAAPPLHFDRWLVPLAGGSNAQRALNYLPGLTRLSPYAQVRLCQVFPLNAANLDLSHLEHCLTQLKPHYDNAISRVYLRDDAVAEAIVNLARYEQDDVIVVGASRSSLLEQVIKGNIPVTIAKNSDCTVILVRGALENR
jgi:CIC family chloride channel protein